MNRAYPELSRLASMPILVLPQALHYKVKWALLVPVDNPLKAWKSKGESNSYVLVAMETVSCHTFVINCSV